MANNKSSFYDLSHWLAHMNIKGDIMPQINGALDQLFSSKIQTDLAGFDPLAMAIASSVSIGIKLAGTSLAMLTMFHVKQLHSLRPFLLDACSSSPCH